MFKTTRILLLTVLMSLLASCARPTPIPVFVTPTPSGPTSIPATMIPATVEQLVIPTDSALDATPEPSATPTAVEGTFGPAIPPDYTLQPTTTPRPTETLLPGTATVTPTPTVSPTPPPGLDPARVGLQIHPRITQDEWRHMLSLANDLNVGWIKVQFPWDEMEPDGPGSQSVHWRELELYMQDALGHGFQVMVSITKAPDWARNTNEENGPPTDPARLASFISHILDRFGPAIHAIEVWNEPNLRREWNGRTISGAEYMRYFDTAYKTITAWSQQNSHPIKVVTAGLAPTGTSDWSLDDRVFLRQMYNAGLANYAGAAIGIHPYGWGNDPQYRCCNPVSDRGWDDDPHFFFLDTIETYRTTMATFGDTDAQLWVTEFGWATYDGFGAEAPQPFFNYVNEVEQASYTIDAIDVIQNSGNYDYVGPMILWNLNFATLPEAVSVRREEQAGYSLLRPDYSKRPLYIALGQSLNR